MRKRLTVMLLLIFLVLCGCGKHDEDKDGISIGNHYVATIQVIVHGNKADSCYKMKCWCDLPDKLRIETLEPEFLNTKLIVKNGNEWRMRHPLISTEIHTTGLLSSDELLLLGIFDSGFVAGCQRDVETLKEEGFICLSKSIQTKNRYRETAALYLNEETKTPEMLRILDYKGNSRVEIEYLDFESNAGMNNEMFE